MSGQAMIAAPAARAGERFELPVTGMSCASCVAHVEQALKRVPGVIDAQVNLATEQARVIRPASVANSALIKAVEHAGYHAAIADNRGNGTSGVTASPSDTISAARRTGSSSR